MRFIDGGDIDGVDEPGDDDDSAEDIRSGA
jgi:hypothetical protein